MTMMSTLVNLKTTDKRSLAGNHGVKFSLIFDQKVFKFSCQTHQFECNFLIRLLFEQDSHFVCHEK